MKRLILLNAPVLTNFGRFEFSKLTIEEARRMIRESEIVESSIGHAATAEIMSELLDFKIETKRTDIFQTEDDTALIFRLKKRIGEGKVLNRQEIEEIGYDLGILIKLR